METRHVTTRLELKGGVRLFPLWRHAPLGRLLHCPSLDKKYVAQGYWLLPAQPRTRVISKGTSALTIMHNVGIYKIRRKPESPTWQITIRMHLLTIMEAVIVAASHTRSSYQSSRLSLHAIAVYAPRFGLPPTQCSIQIAESLPVQKGYLWTFPSSDDLCVVEKGDGTLKEYLFANKTMSHMFCPNCTSISGLISSDVVWEACIRST